VAPDRVEGNPVNPTITYWMAVVALCIFFPPLLGFVLGVGLFCLIWWFWMKVLGA
jgi:hypothetical protein